MNRTEIESRIGYTFRDGALLERALTHGSAESDPEKNYQSLEFLGDSILSFVVAKNLSNFILRQTKVCSPRCVLASSASNLLPKRLRHSE